MSLASGLPMPDKNCLSEFESFRFLSCFFIWLNVDYFGFNWERGDKIRVFLLKKEWVKKSLYRFTA